MRAALYENHSVSQIVIGLAEATSSEAYLEIGYGIEEQGLLYRFDIKDTGANVFNIAVLNAMASGLGVGIGLNRLRCVVVVNVVGKYYPIIEQSLNHLNENDRSNMLRKLGKQAARLALQKPLE